MEWKQVGGHVWKCTQAGGERRQAQKENFGKSLPRSCPVAVAKLCVQVCSEWVVESVAIAVEYSFNQACTGR